MNILKGSLCHLITTKFGCDVSSEEFYAVFAHTLSYITRGITYSEYQERLKPYCAKLNFSAKDFRLMLHDSEYLGLLLKLYCFRLGKLRSVTKEAAQALQREYRLRTCDAISIYRFWHQQRKFRVRIKDAVRDLDANTHLNVQVLRQALRTVLKPVSKHIKSYTYRKLRFICKSQNRDLADMHSELTIKVTVAFYKMMPCTLEPLHVVNYLKRAVTNGGTNIIDTNTSQKAGRLVNNDETGVKRDSFSLLVVSENQMRLTSEGEAISYEELAGHNPIERIEIEHSVTQLVSSVKEGSKKHKFLTILLGSDDEEFTTWLREHKHCNARETNSDFQLKADPTLFNILLGRFLRVNQRKVEVFITKLRTSLDPTAEPFRVAA